MFNRRPEPPPPPQTPPWFNTLLNIGYGAAAMAAIVGFLAYCAPVMVAVMTSDRPPLEGRLEHEKDIAEHVKDILKLLDPITKSAEQAGEAANKAIQAANNSLGLAESVQIKSDQADLCRAVDRLVNIETLLKADPENMVMLEFRKGRVLEIARIRKKFEASGVIAEC